ncbi:unnamed protein product [Paramecium octaurelia]|uniref:Uncharacterized protein n=1 Tax=Paramecium octaurelia TaxID=43137 RepID=A0A8S1U7T6_PAROT|nr:unnamed protein product [Paramecium octaurelia]
MLEFYLDLQLQFMILDNFLMRRLHQTSKPYSKRKKEEVQPLLKLFQFSWGNQGCQVREMPNMPLNLFPQLQTILNNYKFMEISIIVMMVQLLEIIFMFQISRGSHNFITGVKNKNEKNKSYNEYLNSRTEKEFSVLDIANEHSKFRLPYYLLIQIKQKKIGVQREDFSDSYNFIKSKQ